MKFKLTESRLNKILRESINKVLNESFKSKKLDRLNREHGGIEHPYFASELTDDEVLDEPYDSRMHHNYYSMKDSTKTPLNLSREHHRLWQNGNDKINQRLHDPYYRNDGAREYQWSNHDAERMVTNARPNDNGKYSIHPSFREETPTDELFNGKGDPMANWEQIYDGEGNNYNFNTSPMNRAKMDYRNRGMSPSERHDYYKSKLGRRVVDME